ncbi:Putative ribonuclease H protein At1g65750 [Linum perenne]
MEISCLFALNFSLLASPHSRKSLLPSPTPTSSSDPLRNVVVCLDRTIIGMTPPCARLDEDTIAWGLEENDCFSVKSAYLLIKDIEPNKSEATWNKVWSWEGPAKVKQFMWLVTHGNLMTNEERRRRHISTDATCPECKGGCEDIDHVIRSCSLAQGVWRCMLPNAIASTNATSYFDGWWLQGIGDSKTRLTFGIIVWMLWRHRNSLVFHDENLDPTSAAAGGISRDANGSFIAAFSANLGVCSIMRSELRAIVEGIKLAWSKGIRRLRIQTDSKAAIAMLSKPNNVNSQHANLIEQFYELSSRDWQVSVHHIYREANCAADHLANLGHSLDLGIHVFEFPVVSLQYWLRFDLVGSCTSRSILNTM